MHGKWFSFWHTNSFTVLGEFFDGIFLLLFTAQFYDMHLPRTFQFPILLCFSDGLHLQPLRFIFVVMLGDGGRKKKLKRNAHKAKIFMDCFAIFKAMCNTRNVLATMALHTTHEAHWIYLAMHCDYPFGRRTTNATCRLLCTFALRGLECFWRVLFTVGEPFFLLTKQVNSVPMDPKRIQRVEFKM